MIISPMGFYINPSGTGSYYVMATYPVPLLTNSNTVTGTISASYT